MILLLFDCSKLDISDEFKSVIEELQPFEDKVQCVLNKADQLDQVSLMRVYGALLWSMGRIFKGMYVCMYVCMYLCIYVFLYIVIVSSSFSLSSQTFICMYS